jgi:hypothetical protein
MLEPAINPQVSTYQALVIRQALITYAKHKLMLIRRAKPAQLMTTAETITGQKFKPRAYIPAANALGEWLKDQTGQAPKNHPVED